MKKKKKRRCENDLRSRTAGAELVSSNANFSGRFAVFRRKYFLRGPGKTQVVEAMGVLSRVLWGKYSAPRISCTRWDTSYLPGLVPARLDLTGRVGMCHPRKPAQRVVTRAAPNNSTVLQFRGKEETGKGENRCFVVFVFGGERGRRGAAPFTSQGDLSGWCTAE